MPQGYSIKDGTIINATRYAKLQDLGGLPRVSEICHIMPNIQLERWKCRQCAKAAYDVMTNESQGYDIDEESCIKMALDAQEQIGTDAAEAGSAIHYFMEHGEVEKPDSVPFNIVKELSDNRTQYLSDYGLDEFETVVIDRTIGFGGRVDAISRKNNIITDWKTKDLKGRKVVASDYYDTWIFQLAAYRHGLEMDDARLQSVIIDRQTGMFYPREWSEIEAQWGIKAFKICHELYCHLHDYDIKKVIDTWKENENNLNSI